MNVSKINLLRDLSVELRETDVGHQVDVLQWPVDAVRFAVDYVSSNKPCVIKGAIEHWPALRLWSKNYLTGAAGNALVTVDVTPNGRGDAVVACTNGSSIVEYFVTPHEESMTLADFQHMLASTAAQWGDEVPYVQHQNSNLTEEFTMLLRDVEAELPWARAVFGAAPDAVNLWIGDDRSVTSFHKDHYENLYAVVAGSKVFTLLPPSDVYRMHLGRYPAATYERIDGKLQPVLKEPLEHVTWCPVDPNPKDAADACAKYPLFFDPDLPEPLRVVVGPGDLLYLPSMWYHHVAQRADNEGKVVAVNYWYDMRFDVKYAYFKLVEGLAVQLGLVPPALPCPAAASTSGCGEERAADHDDDEGIAKSAAEEGGEIPARH